MESLSRAFSLMLNFAQVRSRLQHSSIQKQMCEQVKHKSGMNFYFDISYNFWYLCMYVCMWASSFAA